MNEWIVIVYANSASKNTKKSSKHCQKRGSHEENLAQDKRQKGKESKREREKRYIESGKKRENDNPTCTVTVQENLQAIQTSTTITI